MSSAEDQTKGSDCEHVNITIALITENSRSWLSPHVQKFQNENPHITINLGKFGWLMFDVKKIYVAC